MGRMVVTGAAGFIGSHLTEALLAAGHDVVGVDCFTDYYDPGVKHANLGRAKQHDAFDLRRADLADADLEPVLDGAEAVFHLAAQPGVRASWGPGFSGFLRNNPLATQRLLDACRGRPGLRRFVYASSSSVYGNAPRYPTVEEDLPRPFSPYGVTKLAGEHLANLYGENYEVPVTSLRLFTVYGPRQRPDMAFHRLCEAAVRQSPFELFGDGSAIRDFTYVGDVVAGFVLAADAPVPPGTVLNLSGGSDVSMAAVLELLDELAGRQVTIARGAAQAGDVQRTGGSSARARELLGWAPQVDVREGLSRQLDWHRSRER